MSNDVSLKKAAVTVCEDMLPAVTLVASMVAHVAGTPGMAEMTAKRMVTWMMEALQEHAKVIATTVNDREIPITVAGEMLVRYGAQLLVDGGNAIELLAVMVSLSKKTIAAAKTTT